VIDENGVYYRVPISCINEPMNYNVNYQDQKLKAKAKPAEKIYNVRRTFILYVIIVGTEGARSEGRLHDEHFKPSYNI
jgi:hypothetical protein